MNSKEEHTCEHCKKRGLYTLIVAGVCLWYCHKHYEEARRANAVLRMFSF
jgi:hypothetical protein